jgi:hypothetical protein
VGIFESQRIAEIWSGARLVETSGLGHRRILYDEAVVRAAIEFLSEGLLDRCSGDI